MKKERIELKHSCTLAMFQYLKNNNLSDLLSELKRAEDHCTKTIDLEGGSIWFKFGSDDTLATTIKNIETHLLLPKSHSNHKFMLECFQLVCDGNEPDNELNVFYS